MNGKQIRSRPVDKIQTSRRQDTAGKTVNCVAEQNYYAGKLTNIWVN